MHMIGHDHIAIDRVSIIFEEIEPLVNDVIAINLGYKRKPLMARKSNKEHSAAKWYGSFNGHL